MYVIYIYIYICASCVYISMCVNATRVKLDDQAPKLILFTAHWDPESPLWETRACDGDIPLKGCWILSFPDKMYTSV